LRFFKRRSVNVAETREGRKRSFVVGLGAHSSTSRSDRALSCDILRNSIRVASGYSEGEIDLGVLRGSEWAAGEPCECDMAGHHDGPVNNRKKQDEGVSSPRGQQGRPARLQNKKTARIPIGRAQLSESEATRQKIGDGVDKVNCRFG
jgi:hypothetical protein